MSTAASDSPLDLNAVGPGFSDPPLASQAVFRVALNAFATPGRIQRVASDAQHPIGVAPSAAALLLALLDPDCTLWLAPRLARSSAAAWLRFHTGCRIVSEPRAAQFLWSDADQMPPLDQLPAGSEFEPESAATCLIQVHALEDTAGWRLRGPGIERTQPLTVRHLGEGFVTQWRANHAAFPRGVDLLLCAGECVAGLPRTTTIED
ncbi:MAG: phosphonate C-P lyase system protein PhnH [Steroidobacteraceae bacterium]